MAAENIQAQQGMNAQPQKIAGFWSVTQNAKAKSERLCDVMAGDARSTMTGWALHLQGFAVVECCYCGNKPALLLRCGDEWCVYRSFAAFYQDEASARRCFECMLEHQSYVYQDWKCPSPQRKRV